MSFDSLGLSAELLRAVAEQGYAQPTAIQARAIPAVLDGHDIMAGAQTGTGKTAGFTLPMLQRLASSTAGAGQGRRPKPHIRALVLTPTRELAAQVGESVATYGKHLALRSTVIFGGVGIQPQINRLRAGVDILIATPGRLLDHAGQGTVNLSGVEILVLDEADRMLDMGFIHDIRKVLDLLPRDKQSLLFSATFSKEIQALADKLLNQPKLIQVTPRNTASDLVNQVIHPVDRDRKRELLARLIRDGNWYQVLVFTRTKHGANRLAQQLEKDGISAAAIHGNKSQAARTRALAAFKNGKLQALVATDIAARGLDIDQLPHVVNYELPNVPEDYVHRIGRTGRAGNGGEAVSLVCIDEKHFLKQIERLLKRTIPQTPIAGFEPDPNIRPQPIFKNQQTGRQPPGGQRRTGVARASRDGKSGKAAHRRDNSRGNGSGGRNRAGIRRRSGRSSVAA